MTKIDTSGWGEFRIGDMFDVSYGKFIAKKEADENANIPHITASGVNNGISYNVSEAMFPANCLTVASDGAIGATYYQDTPFSASNIVSVLVPHTGIDLSKYVALFICTAIKAASRKYSWGGFKFSVDRVRNTTILLPQTPDHTPDFDYMEDYIKEITKLAAKRVEKLKEEKTKYKIDTTNWKKFRVGDLFEIKPTKSYKMRNADLLDGGNTPVVVNSAFNNGIGGFTTQEPTEKGGIITFSDTVDANTIFYQEKPFAGYSHVQGVYPVGEWANEWDKYSLLFFASCFKSTALRYGFDYSNKFRRDVALELKVLLPQTPDHTPDFDYMENYMKNLTEKAKKKLSNIPQ